MPIMSTDKIKVFSDVTRHHEWASLYAFVPYGSIVLYVPYYVRVNAITLSNSALHLREASGWRQTLACIRAYMTLV